MFVVTDGEGEKWKERRKYMKWVAAEVTCQKLAVEWHM